MIGPSASFSISTITIMVTTTVAKAEMVMAETIAKMTVMARDGEICNNINYIDAWRGSADGTNHDVSTHDGGVHDVHGTQNHANGNEMNMNMEMEMETWMNLYFF